MEILFVYFYKGDTLRDAQGLFLAMHSEIAPGVAWRCDAVLLSLKLPKCRFKESKDTGKGH